MAASPSSGAGNDDKLSLITEMLMRLEPDIAFIKTNIEEVRSEMHSMREDQNTKIVAVANELRVTRNDVAHLEAENKQLHKYTKVLTDKVNQLECYSRRTNLIFFNIEEDEQPLSPKVRSILSKMGVPGTDKMIFQAVHRLGKPNKSRPRPVIIRFDYLPDRQAVWDARRNLKGTNYSLDEDLPEDYKRDRGLLMPVMKAARAGNHKASMVANKVRIEGRLYGVDQMNELPANCKPELGCTKETDKCLSYFGRYSPFSNFYSSPIHINSITYSNMEQFIQNAKAELMGEDAIATSIRSEHNPSIIKQMAKSIKGDLQIWYSQAKELVFPALKDKFTQNPKLLAYLLSTGNKVIGEASTDKFWGTGIKLENPKVNDQNMWSGKNAMGEMLMRIRAELKPQ